MTILSFLFAFGIPYTSLDMRLLLALAILPFIKAIVPIIAWLLIVHITFVVPVDLKINSLPLFIYSITGGISFLLISGMIFGPNSSAQLVVLTLYQGTICLMALRFGIISSTKYIFTLNMLLSQLILLIPFLICCLTCDIWDSPKWRIMGLFFLAMLTCAILICNMFFDKQLRRAFAYGIKVRVFIVKTKDDLLKARKRP